MHITLSQEDVALIAAELTKQVVPAVIKELEKRPTLPPLLTRTEFMELVGISATKCAELFNRRDFPVNREFGHPRVPTELLFQWVEQNTDWVREHAPHLDIRPRAI